MIERGKSSSTLCHTILWVITSFSGFLVLSCILGVVIEIFLVSLVVVLMRALIFSPKPELLV